MLRYKFANSTAFRNVEGITCNGCKVRGMPCTWTKSLLVKSGYTPQKWRDGVPISQVLAPFVQPSGHQRFFEIGPVILEMMPVDKFDPDHDDQIDPEMKTLSIRSQAHARGDTPSSSSLRCSTFYIDRNRLDHGVVLDDVTLSDKGKTFEFVILQIYLPAVLIVMRMDSTHYDSTRNYAPRIQCHP